MPRPKKIWIVVDSEGQPMGTPEGSLFLTAKAAEDAAVSVGRSKHVVQSYVRKDPKPRKVHPFTGRPARG